jgi:hypothetical protein
MATKPASVQFDESARRSTQSEEALQSESVRWLAALPSEVRPRRLPIEYARIANELARLWGTPKNCISCLNELLIVRRGTRAGFATETALELAHLKNYYETVLHPSTQTVWDEIVARPND